MNTRDRLKKRCETEPVKESSLSIWELQGSPIRDMLNTWVAGIGPIEEQSGPVRIDYIPGKL